MGISPLTWGWLAIYHEPEGIARNPLTMADIGKIVKAAEELVEHSPAAKQLGEKLLEESGILGGAVKLVTKEFEHLAGEITKKGLGSNVTHTFEHEIAWKSLFVKGVDAKSVTVCAKNYQVIENPVGITQIKNLNSAGNGLGSEVLKNVPAPAHLVEKFPTLAEHGVPNWVHGNDDWLFYQANKNFPTKVILDDAGKLHAIEYPEEVKVLAGPFKGLAGTRMELGQTAEGARRAKLYFQGGRHLDWQHDEYEYVAGSHTVMCRDFAGPGKMKDVNEIIPEDIQGFEHWFMREFWK